MWSGVIMGGSCLLFGYQTPNQEPVPCTTATGKKIAPAIRKPQLAALKQTTKCVNHAANTQPTNANIATIFI